jgi:polyvinyl alcohol dehydrogenase (cytochrome)
VLWSFDTNQSFDTVSGDKAHGGSVEAAGAIVVGGRVAVNSGYSFGGRMGGNVLLVFSVDGK